MKRTEGFDYFTYEICDKFRSQEFARRRFSIPALEIDGSILDATRMLIGIIVRYQQSVAEQISDVIASLDLPDEYVGLHIRGGDKTREAKVFSADEYMALLARHTRVRNVFVMTDDFGHIEHLRRRYADYAFFTKCRADERGTASTSSCWLPWTCCERPPSRSARIGRIQGCSWACVWAQDSSASIAMSGCCGSRGGQRSDLRQHERASDGRGLP